MKYKFIIIFLVLIAAVSLFGCSNSAKEDTTEPEPNISLGMNPALESFFWGYTYLVDARSLSHSGVLAHNQESKVQFKKAIELFQEAIRLQPDYTEAYFYMGNAYDELKLYPEAIESYKNAITFQPDYAEAHSNLGAVYIEQELYPQAKDAYRETVRIQPDNSSANHRLKILELFIAAQEAIVINPDDAMAHYNLGAGYVEFGLYKEADESLNEAIRIQPDYGWAYFQQGFVYERLFGLRKALQSFQQATRLQPDLAEAYFKVGSLSSILHQTEEAEVAYKEAIRINPDYAEAHYSLGNLCDNQDVRFRRTTPRRKIEEGIEGGNWLSDFGGDRGGG